MSHQHEQTGDRALGDIPGVPGAGLGADVEPGDERANRADDHAAEEHAEPRRQQAMPLGPRHASSCACTTLAGTTFRFSM